MTIDVFTATGQKKGTMDLPVELFAAPINHGLIHQALVMQQSNRRNPIAHAKNRHEVAGSTRKLYAQKHTGRARRGSIRSPLLRGGGKAFGPRKDANFTKDMPKAMRRSALFACLSFQAKKGSIVGLESYPETIKTKDLTILLGKLPGKDARRILLVVPEKHEGLFLSCRNLSHVKTIMVSYLNPEDVVHARSIVFVGDAIARAVLIFGTKGQREQKLKLQADTDIKAASEKEQKKVKPSKTKKKTAEKTEKAAPKKKTSSKKSSASSK